MLPDPLSTPSNPLSTRLPLHYLPLHHLLLLYPLFAHLPFTPMYSVSSFLGSSSTHLPVFHLLHHPSLAPYYLLTSFISPFSFPILISLTLLKSVSANFNRLGFSFSPFPSIIYVSICSYRKLMSPCQTLHIHSIFSFYVSLLLLSPIFPLLFISFLTHFFPSFTPSRFPLTNFPSFFSSPSSCFHLNLLFPVLIFTLHSIPLFSAPHSLLLKKIAPIPFFQTNTPHSLLSNHHTSFTPLSPLLFSPPLPSSSFHPTSLFS